MLDTGVVVVFQRGSALDALELAATDGLVVVEEVFDELTGRLRAPKDLDARERTSHARSFLTRVCDVVSVTPGSAADSRREALRKGRSSTRADFGEDVSVAWAMEHDDVALVTNDERAVGRALRELPGRVRMTHELMLRIIELHPTAAPAMRSLAEAAARALEDKAGWGSSCPLWWTDRVAELVQRTRP